MIPETPTILHRQKKRQDMPKEAFQRRSNCTVKVLAEIWGSTNCLFRHKRKHIQKKYRKKI